MERTKGAMNRLTRNMEVVSEKVNRCWRTRKEMMRDFEGVMCPYKVLKRAKLVSELSMEAFEW